MIFGLIWSIFLKRSGEKRLKIICGQKNVFLHLLRNVGSGSPLRKFQNRRPTKYVLCCNVSVLSVLFRVLRILSRLWVKEK